MKKNVRTIFKTVIISVSILWAIIVVAVIIIFITAFKEVVSKPIDITNIPGSLLVSFTSSNGSTFHKDSDKIADLKWYGTLEEALENDTLIRKEDEDEPVYKKIDAIELFRVQKDGRMAVFYTRVPEEGDVSGIACVILEIEDGKFSQPIKMKKYGNRPGYTNMYGYDCDDGVVFYIEEELILGPVLGVGFGTGQNEIPICFGMWDNKEEIESLTVMGKSPQIIEVAAKEDTRYFWYYEDLDWIDKLEEIDWSDYTYKQVIDKLEIKYNQSN